MRKFKKALAFALASAMIVSAVPASAAAKTNSAKGTKSTIYTYTVDKSKQGNPNNKRSWIQVTTKKGYTYKLVNKTTSIVSLTKTRVEAKKAGTAKINVNFYKNGKYVETKSVKITVKKAPMIGAVTLNKSEITVGETATVSNAGKGTAYFYSSNKDVATVDKKTGEITAKAAGTTTITAVNTITKARVKLDLTVNAQFAAKQSGAKEITVTGNGFTKDTKLSVKRGNTTVDIDTTKVEVSSDGKTIIIPVKSTISAAEYTVTAGDKTATFKGEASKVSAIDVSDVAVVDKGVTLPIASNATASGATIAYTVKNQFGEDITKTTNVQANVTRKSETPSQGKLKVSLNAYDKAGDEITVVFIYTETGLSVTKNVKISNAATANEVTVKGIYNESNKELTEDTMNGKNTFYLLLDVVDQYGNNMANNSFKVGTDMESDLIASAAPGATNVTLDTKNATVKTVDGKEYVAVPLTFADTKNEKAGTGTVSVVLITKLGQSFTGSFEVKAGTKVDTFTAAPSDVVIAGKETVFDFTALDTYGNDISEKVTKEMFAQSTQDSLFTSKDSGYFKFVKDSKTGKNQLVFDGTGIENATADRVVVASFITATNKVVNVQFTVKADAKPVSLESKDDFGMIASNERTSELNAKDVKVTDQYGTNYTFKEFSAKPSDTAKSDDYALVIERTSGDDVTLTTSTGEKAVFTAAEDKVGTTTFTLSLYKGAEKLSSEEFSIVTKKLDDVVTSASDVTITDMPKMYYKSERDLTVKAKVNGMEVTLEAGTDYRVLTNDVDTGNVVSGGAINTSASKAEVAGKYTVIIGNTAGTEITKDVTVCTAAPKAATAEVKDDAEKLTTADKLTVNLETVLKRLTVKDQYGATMDTEKDLLTTARVAFSDYGDNTPVDNNTASASVTLPANSSVTAKVTFAGGYTFTTTIVVSK